MEKNMETTVMGCTGTTKRIHSFVPVLANQRPVECAVPK